MSYMCYLMRKGTQANVYATISGTTYRLALINCDMMALLVSALLNTDIHPYAQIVLNEDSVRIALIDYE